jgi:hypothetical protein
METPDIERHLVVDLVTDDDFPSLLGIYSEVLEDLEDSDQNYIGGHEVDSVSRWEPS